MSEVILLLRGGCTRRLNYKIYFVTAKARMQVVLIAVIAVCSLQSAVKYSLVWKSLQTSQKGQNKAELTLLPRLYVKLLITAITAIGYMR